MQRWTLIAAVVVVIVVVAAVAVVLVGSDDDTDTSDDDDTSTTNSVTEIVTDDPTRETADADGRLWIIGNANMDDYLDEDDIEWIEKIIAGTANEVIFNAGLSDYSVDVRMADANQDGVIDQADIDMVQAMIELTTSSEQMVIYYIDVDGAINTVHVPVLTVVSFYIQNTKQLLTIDGMDNLVGTPSSTFKYVWLQDYEENVSYVTYSNYEGDAEEIMALDPDAVLTGTRQYYCNSLEEALQSAGSDTDIVRIASWEDDKTIEGTLTLGFMMCKQDEAWEYVEWADYYLDLISDKVATLSDDEIVKVLCPRGEYSDWNITMNGPRGGKYETTLTAGAYNVIIDNLTSSSTNVVVTDEWVFSLTDLDFIVCIVYGDLDNQEMNGYTNESFYETAVEYWSSMTEAYGTEIHVLDNLVSQGTTYVIGAVYMAKWFYPDLFEDMDPDAIFQEFMDNFFRYDFDVAAYQATGGIAI